MQTIYLISGPLGVGKTTVAKELHKSLEKSKLIEGDSFLNGEFGRDDLTWEKRLELTWNKIASLTKGFFKESYDVVIDFVVEEELSWFCEQVAEFNPLVKYAVLMADKETIVKRLQERDEIKCLDRSMVLLDQLSKSEQNKNYILDTRDKEVFDIVNEILDSSKFMLGEVK